MNANKLLRRVGTIAVLGLTWTLLAAPAQATVYTWNANTSGAVTDGSGVWNTSSTNWWNGSADVVWPNNTNIEQFGTGSGGTNPYTVTLSQGITVGGITFQNQAYTLAGSSGTITLGSSPTITANASGGTISTNLVNTTSTTTLTGTGTLTLGGVANFTGQTVNFQPFASSTSGTVQVVNGANISATNLNLYQANSVSNSTLSYIQTGGLVNVATSFVQGSSTTGGESGDINNATISGGTLTTGTLQMYKWATCYLTVSGSGLVNAGNLYLGWSDSSPTGTINIGDGATFSGGTSIKNGGTSGILTIGSYTANSVRNYTLNFNGGTLKASAGGSSWLASGVFTTAAVNAAGGIIDNGGYAIGIGQVLAHGTGTPDGGLVFQGLGTTTLTGANTYNGGTTINAGTLVAAASALPSSGTLTVNDATFSMVTGTAHTVTVGGLNLSGSAKLAMDWGDTISTTAATATGNIALIPSGTFTPGTGYTVLKATGGGLSANYFLSNTNYTASLSVASTGVTITPSATAPALTTAYWYGNQVPGALGAMALSNGTLSNWSTGQTYTATALVPSSTANVVFSTTDGGATQEQSVVLGANMTLSSLTFSDTNAVTIGADGNTLTLMSNGSGTSSAISANQSAAINANVALGAAQTWTVNSGTLTVGGPVIGAFGLTTAGTGTVLLAGNNSYSGSTTVSAGTLTLSGGLNGSGVSVNGAGAALNETSTGVIGGAGGFTLTNGLATLAGNNSYSGSTTVSAGTLQIGAGGASGAIGSTSGVTIASGATLLFDRSDNYGGTFAPTISGAGTLAVSAGSLALSNTANSYTGGTTITGGVLSFANSSLGSSGNITLSGGGLQWNGSNTQDISNRLVLVNSTTSTLDTNGNSVTLASGFGGGRSGALVKVGAGTLILSASNGYSGGTTISAGTLQIGSGGTAGTAGSGPIVDNAALVYNLTSGSITNAISGTGNVSNTGATGTITLAQNIALNNGNFTFNTVGATINSGVNLSVGSGTGTINSTTGQVFLQGVTSLSASGAGVLAIGGTISTTSGGIAGLVLNGGSLTTAGNINLNGRNSGSEWGIEYSGGTSYITATSGTTTLTADIGSNANGKSPYLFINGPTVNLNAAAGAAIVFQGGAASATGINIFRDYSGGTVLNTSGAVTFQATTTDPTSAFWSGSPQYNVASGSLLLNGGVTTMSNGLKVSSSGNSTVTIAGSGSGTMSGGMTINGSSLTYNIGGTGAVTQSALISGSGALINNGVGTVTLGYADTYTGGTTINAGVLAYGIASALPSSGTVNINGGSLNLATFSGNAGTIVLSGGAISGSTGVLTGAAYNVQNGSINGILGGSNIVLTKSTTGTVTVGAALTYTGSTNVNAGSLLLNSGALSTSSKVYVANGATFGGIGSAGTATVAAGGSLQAGNGISGTTTLAGLVFSGSGSINIGTLANYASTPAIAVSGSNALSTNGANSVTISVTSLAGDALNTPYELLSYSGAIGGSGSGGFQLAALPGRAIGALSAAGGYIDLTITGSGDYLHWSGANSNVWDASTPNWTLNSTGAPTTFINGTPTGGDSVVFDNAAGTNTSVSLAATLYPTAVTVSGSNNFSFSGSGSIAGATGLTVSGPGTLLISIPNSFTGGTTLSGGTLQVGNAGALGTGNVTLSGGALTSNGTSAYAIANPLVLNGLGTLGDPTNSGQLTFTAASGALTANSQLTINSPVAINSGLSGGYGLTVVGPSILTLTGSNTYTGSTNVNGGTLAVNGSLAGGSSVAVNAGGTLAGAGTISGPTTLSGGVIGLSGGTIANTLGVSGGTWNGSGTVTGAITASSGLFTVGSGANLTAKSTLTLSGGSLAWNGSGTVTGAITSINALFTVGSGGTLTDSGGMNINIGSTLAGAGTVNGNATLASGGAINFSSGGQISGTLTANGGSWNGLGSVGGGLNANGPLNLGSGANLTVNGGVTFGGGNLSGPGTVTLGTTPTITLNANSTVNSTIVDTATSVSLYANSSALTLGGATNFSGQTLTFYNTTTANGGTLQLVNGSNFTAGTVYIGGYNTSNSGLTGYYVQSGGSANITGTLELDWNYQAATGGTSNAIVTGGTLAAGTLQYYKWGFSNLAVSGSGMATVGSFEVGWDASTNGNVNIGDGLTFSGGTSIQNGGTSGVLTVGGFVYSGVGSSRSVSLNFNGGTLKAGAAGSNWLPSGYFATAAVEDAGGIIDNGGYAITIGQSFAHGGVSSTDGGLIFQGAGTTTLSSVSSYNGGTYVNGGVLNYGVNNALPTSGAISVNGGTLGIVSFSGSAGVVTLKNGAITGASGVLTGTAYNVQNGSISAILGGTGALTVGTGGVAAISSPSTYSGVTTIGGLLNVGSLANVNTPSAIGQGSVGGSAADLVINGGTMQYTGLSAASTNRLFTVGSNGAAALDASGAGSLTIGSSGGSVAFANSSAPATLTLTGSGVGVLGAAVGNSGTGLNLTSLVKAGNGTWALNGANTYSGNTSVNSGALYVNGSLLSTGTVNVAGGATLGGSGSAGQTFVANGGAINLSQNSGSTFSLAALNFAGSASLSVNDSSGQYASTPAISVANLTTSSTINLNVSNVPAGTGTMEIVQYGSIGGSGTAAFQLASPVTSGRSTYTLVSNGTSIDLSYFIDYPFWTGAGGNSWDFSSTNNWALNSSSASTTFLSGDNVVFDDRAGVGSSQVVSINGSDVTPASVTFSNSTASYTLQGSNAIAGNATLTVNGGGLVTINNTNSFTGGTTLSAGTLNAGGAFALGTGPVAVSGGLLNATAANALGSGPLAVSGGAVGISASQSVASVSLSGGTLNASAIGGLGSGPLGVSGGVLVSSASQAVSSVTLGGGLVSFASGGLGLGNVNFVANSTLQWYGNNTQDVSGQLLIGNGVAATLDTQGNNVTLAIAFGASGGGSLVKVGSGVLTLAANNTYGGGTTISAGTLLVGTGGTAGSMGFGPVVDNGALVYNLSSIAVNTAISGSGSVAGTTAGALTISQNIALTNSNFTFNSAGATIASGVNLSVGTGVGTITSVSGGGSQIQMEGVNSLSASGTGSINLSGQIYTTGGGNAGLNLTGGSLTTSGSINLSGKNTGNEWGIEFSAGTSSITALSGTMTLTGNSSSNSSTKSPYLFINSATVNLTASPGAAIVLAGGANSGTNLAIFCDYSTGAVFNVSGNVSFISASTDPTSAFWGQGGSTGSGGGAPVFNVANGSTLLLNGGVTNMTTGLKVNSTNSAIDIFGSGSGTMSGAMAVNGGTLDYNISGSGVVTASGSISGAGALVKNGGGSLTLTTADSLSGNTTINAGTLQLNASSGSSGALGSPTIAINGGGALLLNAQDVLGYTSGREALVINGGTVSNITSGSRVTIQNTITMTGGVLTGSGSGDGNGVYSFNGAGLTATSDANGNPAIVSANSISLQAGNLTFNVARGTASPAADLEVFSSITPDNGSAFGISKTGNGIMLLAGSNSYTGGTSISNNGVLKLGNSAALPANGALTANGGTLDMAGYSPAVGNFSGANGIVTNSSATPTTLTVNQTSNASFSGAINESAGQIALVKTGANMLTLANANNYGGGTTIQNGTLQLGNSGAFGTGNLAADGGILDMNGYSVTVPSFSGAGGTVTNNATSTLATLTVNQATNTVFSGAINDGLGQVGLSKNGAGTLTLANVNDYSGATIVAGGVLSAGTAGALSQNSAVTISGGTLDVSGYVQTIASLNMTGGALNLSATNLLTSNGAVQLGGTLNLTGDTGAAVLISSTGTESGQFTSYTGVPKGYRLNYGLYDLAVVTSGAPTWIQTSGGSWSTNANWDSNSAPGTGASQEAIVGAAVTSTSAVTISLDSPQTLGTLTFANSTSNTTGYTLTQGSSGFGSLTMATSDGSAAKIIVTGGSQAIAANVILAGSLTIAPSAGTTLTIAGNMSESLSGSGSLLLNDAGTLVLSGSNGFTGGTVVTDGTLVLTNNNSLYSGTNLTIGDAAAFAGGPTAGSDTGAISSRLNEPLADHEYMVPAPSITPVPEPGTLLLAAAGLLAAGLGLRRKKAGVRNDCLAHR